MATEQEQSAARRIVRTIRAAAWVFLLAITARCGNSTGPAVHTDEAATLRIGVSVGQIASRNAQNGLRQLAPLLTNEGLLRVGEDGRPAAWLAQGWRVSPDGLSVALQLRPGVKFQDGTPVTARAVADILNNVLPKFMGPAYGDIDHIAATSVTEVGITLRQPSAFLLEALEAQIQKPGAGGVSTGPFVPSGSNSPTEMHANPDYYLGKPAINRIVVSTYPSVRAAWAEMLRHHLDMLWDVGVDALDSLEGSKTISIFKYTRHYQYVVIFNTHAPALRSREVRRALSMAVDRNAVVQDALDGHGTASSGPIWPQHWALSATPQKFGYDPEGAIGILAEQPRRPGSRGSHVLSLRIRCSVPPDYDRLALIVKRQLEAVGVELDVQELPPDRIYDAMSKGDFDTVLFDAISGPSLFRPYLWWHSGTTNPAGFSSPVVDAALDQIRHAASDDQYRAGVAAFQQAMMDDPPAIFLAWSQRARAISSRFKVPVEPGRDVLATLRLWKPQADAPSRN